MHISFSCLSWTVKREVDNYLRKKGFFLFSMNITVLIIQIFYMCISFDKLFVPIHFQDYLRMNEAQTLCSLQAQFILDYAALKASLAQTPMIYHPPEESVADIFIRINPGVNYM